MILDVRSIVIGDVGSVFVVFHLHTATAIISSILLRFMSATLTVICIFLFNLSVSAFLSLEPFKVRLCKATLAKIS